MSNPKQSKSTVATKTCQHITFNNDGYILSSDDSIFEAKPLLKEPITSYFPLIESIHNMLVELRDEDPEIRFNKVVTVFQELPGFYDFSFSRTTIDNAPVILWRIYDLTESYTTLRQVQQQHHNEIVFLAKET